MNHFGILVPGSTKSYRSTSISNGETVLEENSVSDAKPNSDTEPILDVASSGSNSDSWCDDPLAHTKFCGSPIFSPN